MRKLTKKKDQTAGNLLNIATNGGSSNVCNSSGNNDENPSNSLRFLDGNYLLKMNENFATKMNPMDTKLELDKIFIDLLVNYVNEVRICFMSINFRIKKK